MAFRLALALAILTALSAAPARADDLDDLDIGPPSPASAAPAPGPKPAASAAPADDDDLLKGDIGLGDAKSGATGATTGPTEAPAPTSLPGGLRDAWNLSVALAFQREAKLDNRPKDPPFKSWQALRVAQELRAILAGAADVPGPLKTLIARRIDGLLGVAAGPATEGDELEASLDPAPKSTTTPAAGLDEEVERLSHALAVLDRSDLARAQEIAKDLATRAGDPSVAGRLAAAAAHGPDLIQFTDRVRTLIHAPAGAAWAIRQLSSGDGASVQAALDYVRDGASIAEVREVLEAVATGRIGASTGGQVVQSVGTLGTDELLGDLEKISAAGLGRAVGEAVGRIRQRSEELASWRSSYSDADRRDAASRINQSGLPLFRGGQYREALVKFRLATELDPAEATFRYNYGSALCRLGNVADGVTWLRQAIAIGPDEMSFYETTLNAMRDLGRRAELVAFLEERAPRVQYSAVVVLVYLNLAHEYVAAGNATAAHQALDIAFSRSVPERYLTPLLARRGDAFMLTGDVAQARRSYQKALEYAPDNKRALDGMQRAEAWQPAGAAAPATAADPADPFATPLENDGGLGVELDAPSPTTAKPAPAAPTAKSSVAAPAPVPSPSAKDELDLDI